MHAFPQLGSESWLPRGRHLRAYVLFEDAPPEKARARTITGLLRPLRQHLAWQGPILRIGCDDVAAQVRKHFGSKKSFTLTDEERAYFAGDEFDEGTDEAVAGALRDYGDSEPWLRFHAAVHRWLLRVHAKRPIALYLRPTLPASEELGARDREGLEALFEHAERLAGLFTGRNDLAEELMKEGSLFAVGDLERAHRYVPCLYHSFGIDAYAAASIDLFCALGDDERASFLRGIPAEKCVGLLLRSDLLPRAPDFGGQGPHLAVAFDAFRASGPSVEAIDAMAKTLTDAMVRCGRDDPSALDAILSELESHPSLYAAARGLLADRAYLLRNHGHAEAHERFEAAVAAMG